MARSIIIYGDSGTAKSTACKHFSHYIYERIHKRTLLLSLDGGGWGPMQPEIDAGIISAYRCNTEVPLSTLRKISQGYWPRDVKATRAAETDLVRIDWSEFGAVIVEGVTSISQALMRHLADQGIKTGEEATNPFLQKVLVEGRTVAEQFAGNSRAHYGFVQNQLYSLITNFNSLPAECVLFTGLESRAEEDDRTLIYGPQIAGKKATALIPSWVGDCLHAQGAAVRKTVQVPDPSDPKKMVDSEIVETVVRMYFVKHPDPVTGIMYPAKPRVSPEAIPKLMEKWPGGFFEPGLAEGFDAYLYTIDKLNAEVKNAVDEWRKKVDEKWGRKTVAAPASLTAAPAASAPPAAPNIVPPNVSDAPSTAAKQPASQPGQPGQPSQPIQPQPERGDSK